jgi:hypothetical protein
VASLEDRIRRLEGRIGGEAPKDQDEAIRHSIITLILDEFARLKASRVAHYRGGVPIVPEDIPFKELGPGYTTGDMWALAVRRVVAGHYDGLSDEKRTAIIEGRTESVRAGWSGFDWDKVDDAPE